MSTQSNVTRFWPKLLAGVPKSENAYVFEDGEPQPENMEKLAKNIEIARAHKVDCEAELMKAEQLLIRQVDAYEAEESRRGLKCRK